MPAWIPYPTCCLSVAVSANCPYSPSLMATPSTLIELRDGFADVAPADWTALLGSLRAAVRAGASNPRDMLTLAGTFHRGQAGAPVSAPEERERSLRIVRLLRERRESLAEVAAAVLEENPARRAWRGA